MLFSINSGLLDVMVPLEDKYTLHPGTKTLMATSVHDDLICSQMHSSRGINEASVTAVMSGSQPKFYEVSSAQMVVYAPVGLTNCKEGDGLH